MVGRSPRPGVSGSLGGPVSRHPETASRRSASKWASCLLLMLNPAPHHVTTRDRLWSSRLGWMGVVGPLYRSGNGGSELAGSGAANRMQSAGSRALLPVLSFLQRILRVFRGHEEALA